MTEEIVRKPLSELKTLNPEQLLWYIIETIQNMDYTEVHVAVGATPVQDNEAESMYLAYSRAEGWFYLILFAMINDQQLVKKYTIHDTTFVESKDIKEFQALLKAIFHIIVLSTPQERAQFMVDMGMVAQGGAVTRSGYGHFDRLVDAFLTQFSPPSISTQVATDTLNTSKYAGKNLTPQK